MARLVKFARGDAPSLDVQTTFSEGDNNTLVISAKGSGGHKIKWQGPITAPSSTAGGSSNPITSTYRVILPNGEQLAIDSLVVVSRLPAKQDAPTVVSQLSINENEMKAIKDGDVDLRNSKAKRIEKDSQTYGRVNTKSAAKPQRMGDEEAKEKDRDRRRQREETVRSAVESGEAVPDNSASNKSSKKSGKK